MKALFIHSNDMTEWRYDIPEKYRGGDFTIHDQGLTPDDFLLRPEKVAYHTITFRWRTQFCRADGRVLFDVFEQAS